MSKEAMKLALEALDAALSDDQPYIEKSKQAIAALREALAKPDFWEGYVPEPVKPAQCKYPKCSYPCPDLPDCRDAEPAQQALDKKAENARELGLDYEPAQQEPFGYFRYDLRLDAWVQNRAGLTGTPFYTSPPAQRTWVSLTDEQMLAIVHYSQLDNARAIEAKLKEMNT